MKKQILSAYFPYDNPGNKYTSNTQKCIRNAGINIVNLKRYMFPLKDFFACKIFNFNWIEDRIADNANGNFRRWLKYVRMCLTFDLIKIKGGKIVWTMHNKLPHSSDKRKYKVKLMRKIARRASAVVIHCPDSVEPLKALYPKIKEEKICLIPHPSYIGSYTPSGVDIKKRLGIKEEEKIFLFMGAARRYKNIETLIIAFKDIPHDKIKLVIAAETDTKEYADELHALAGGSPDIIFDDRFIPDGELADYILTADITVLPYNKETTLNSGSVYMSFSYKTTVVCPAIGTINGLKDKSFVYSYDYAEGKQLDALEETLKKVVSDLKENGNILAEYGQKAYEYMLKEHADDDVSKAYGDLYARLGEE